MYQHPDLNIMKFDSVAELGAHCIKTDLDFDSGTLAWFGGISQRRAAELCITGDDSQVAAAERMMAKFAAPIETGAYLDMPSVAGCYPVVADFLCGEPESMREPQFVGSEAAPLHMLVDVTSSAAISPEQMRKRGIAALSLAMALAATRPITLDVTCVMQGDERPAARGDEFFIVTARIETAPLDITTAAYALTHIGFARRLCYGLGERVGFRGKWPTFSDVDYGNCESPRYTEKVREYLKIDGETLLIPAAHSDKQKIITDPDGWVREHMYKFALRETEF